MGSLAGGPVLLHYHLSGINGLEPKILPLRRFLQLARRGRFAESLFQRDRAIDRWLLLLRVRDALADGATQREIAGALFGDARVSRDWSGDSDSLRSRTRRLVGGARAMARGGYRRLLGGKTG